MDWLEVCQGRLESKLSLWNDSDVCICLCLLVFSFTDIHCHVRCRRIIGCSGVMWRWGSVDNVETRRYYHCEKGKNTLYQENPGSITWTNQVQDLRRAMHMALIYHYVCRILEDNNFRVLCNPSENSKADSLTKVLWKEVHGNRIYTMGITIDRFEEDCSRM